jgi:hypothetical protein
MPYRIEDERVYLTKLNALRESLGAAAGAIKFHVRTLVLDTALTDADGSQAVSIALDDDGRAFPANARPLSAHTLIVAPIGGAGITALTVQIGDAADPDEMLVATNIFGTARNAWTDAPGVGAFGRLEGTAYVPLAQYDSTGGNVAAVTGTVVHVIAYYKMLNPYIDGYVDATAI